MLQACSSDPKGYEDFEHIDHWDELDKIEGEFTIIYYYSPFCDICINMEDEVSELLDDLSSDYEIFLIDAGYILDQGEPDFEMNESVPALLTFENSEFIEWIIGSSNVIMYLEDKQ